MPEGNLLVGGDDGQIRVMSPDFIPMATLDAGTEQVSSMTFSPDARTLATTSGDGTTSLWHTETWQHAHEFPVEHRGTFAAAFHPDKELLKPPGLQVRERCDRVAYG